MADDVDESKADDCELDLPLSANIKDINVSHFLLHLTCDLAQNKFSGDITLFCNPVGLSKTKLQWQDNKSLGTDVMNKSSNTSYHESSNNHLIQSVFVLDAFCLDVSAVEELILTPGLQDQLSHASRDDVVNEEGVYMRCYKEGSTQTLCHSVNKHCIKIWKPCTTHSSLLEKCKQESEFHLGDSVGCSLTSEKTGVTNRDQTCHCDTRDAGIEDKKEREHVCNCCPKVVRICYSTRMEGPSLKWTLDQDGNPCMFTIGHWLNNRSWFPSQDAPSAMPTWQAVIHLPDPHLTVLMSGDNSGVPRTAADGHVSYYYYSTMPMPTSTLAVAIGSWSSVGVTVPENEESDPAVCRVHGSECIVNYKWGPAIQCQIFQPQSLVTVSERDLAPYLAACVSEVCKILGPHPFPRLDVLIVPTCFDSLGMANPNLLLLSQSLLTGDWSMCARVAHEICHSWFGLLIGPQDWTEEWLSEGFCTYLEDIIHARVCKWSEESVQHHLELRKLLKQKTLLSEVKNTPEDLQTLRPNKGEELLQASGCVDYVKNGMNPDKCFTQVHYLKGFFLLSYLQEKTGLERFLHFLRQYVDGFHTQLVTSQDFFAFLFKYFPCLRDDGLTTEGLMSHWLDTPGVPQEVKKFKPSSANPLMNEVESQLATIYNLCHKTKQQRKKKKKLKQPEIHLEKLQPDQIVIVLEELLDLDHIPSNVLDLLQKTYSFQSLNADIRHRWCELVVKHCHAAHYGDVKYFVLNDQAMGVYLYGEMMLASCQELKDLARHCFSLVRHDMPEGAKTTVQSMLYGT